MDGMKAMAVPIAMMVVQSGWRSEPEELTPIATVLREIMLEFDGCDQSRRMK